MKVYWGSGCIIYIFLTSALVGGEWLTSRCPRLIAGERASGTHWIGAWVGPRASLNEVERRKFLTQPGLKLRPLARRASSQLLYRLRYQILPGV
jgi:hypothetical protein